MTGHLLAGEIPWWYFSRFEVVFDYVRQTEQSSHLSRLHAARRMAATMLRICGLTADESFSASGLR